MQLSVALRRRSVRSSDGSTCVVWHVRQLRSAAASSSLRNLACPPERTPFIASSWHEAHRSDICSPDIAIGVSPLKSWQARQSTRSPFMSANSPCASRLSPWQDEHSASPDMRMTISAGRSASVWQRMHWSTPSTSSWVGCAFSWHSRQPPTTSWSWASKLFPECEVWHCVHRGLFAPAAACSGCSIVWHAVHRAEISRSASAGEGGSEWIEWQSVQSGASAPATSTWVAGRWSSWQPLQASMRRAWASSGSLVNPRWWHVRHEIVSAWVSAPSLFIASVPWHSTHLAGMIESRSALPSAWALAASGTAAQVRASRIATISVRMAVSRSPELRWPPA